MHIESGIYHLMILHRKSPLEASGDTAPLGYSSLLALVAEQYHICTFPVDIMQNLANRVEDCEALEVCQYIFSGDMPDNIAESVQSEAKSENGGSLSPHPPPPQAVPPTLVGSGMGYSDEQPSEHFPFPWN